MDKRVWLGNAGRLNFIGLLLVLGCAAWPHAALAADGVVGTGGAASCTEAAFDDTWSAVQSSGGGIITFSCGPAPVTILFTAQKAVSADTELRGGDLISLSGGNATSLFQVFSGQTLRLRNMTLTRAYSLTGAIENFGVVDAQDSHFVNNSATDSGGAISNNGDLTLTRVRFAGNSAVANGGALNLISGNATIIDSQFTGNFATTAIAPPQYGGGGAIYSAAALTITQSVFTQNSAPSGGALFVRTGAASVAETTFSGNWAVENGGAIVNFQGSLGLWDSELKGNGYNLAGVKVTQAGGALNSVSGSSTLVGVTLSGNWAGAGGAYYQQAQLATLTNVTISGNAAAVGGGIYSGFMSYTTLRNVTIAGNSASGRGAGIATAGSYNFANTLLSANINSVTGAESNCDEKPSTASFSLSSDATCGFGAGRDDIDALLGPLGYNGGLTQTHLLQGGSPAIDAGAGSGCPSSDQRGVARPQGAACDVGAVEATAADFMTKVFLPITRKR